MIEATQLSYRYPGNPADTLHELDFSIARGEIFGFLGPSGAGKSTTQRILFQLLPDYRGQVKIESREIRDWGTELFHRIGVGFELPNHYQKLTGRENLRFFGGFYRQTLDADALLERVGLLESADQPVADYSKGMKMRLNFVRALLHDPDILFLDEPTTGLDPGNAHLVKEIIKEWRERGKTIFLTTHRMEDADQLCDRVAFLVDGRIVASDTPTAFKLAHSDRSVEVRYAGADEPARFPLDGLGENAEFLRLLREGEILAIHTREASLDEVFRRVTDQNLAG